MAQRVYISGPMTGIPEWNHPAFNKVASKLRELGEDVCNPAEFFDGNTELHRTDYIRKSIEELLDCTDVVTLPGWEFSEGATLEVQMAKELGYKIQHWNGE